MFTTTAKRVVFYFLILLVASATCLLQTNKYCDLNCDFVVKNFSHTVCDRESTKCGPHPQCGPDFKIVPLSDHQRQYVVDLHNYLRNKVAMGKEGRGKQPPASNMNVMTYNRELEFIAQCWANTCNGNPLVHDVCRRTEKYDHVGQNLGFINSSTPINITPKSLKELIMLWYNEVGVFQSEWVKDTRDRGPNFKVGHYTQMMWAETSEIGCAATAYSKARGQHQKWHNIVLVCNYGPGGNYLGSPIYDVGKPCSKCLGGLKQSKQYPGLCGKGGHVSLLIKNKNLIEI